MEWTLEKAQEYVTTQFEATSHYVETNGTYWGMKENIEALIKALFEARTS